MVIDAVIVGLLSFYSVVVSAVTSNVSALVDVGLFLPLLWRRTRPVLSFAVVASLLLVQLITTDAPRLGDVSLLVALYSISAYGPTWARWAGMATGLAGAVLAGLDWRAPSTSAGDSAFEQVLLVSTVLAAFCLFAWTLGDLMRTRRAYVAGLEQRAVQLERDAAQQAAIATAAERARIARELHDVVAHSLSVIVVQADGALYAARTSPEVATETLSTISSTGRESLAQMRSLLGLLRGDDRPDGLTPVPSVTDLDSLVDQVRASGVTVGLTTRGDVARLDPATGLTAFRVVQEALTNTLKHAGPQVRAHVGVEAGPESVVVTVVDDGRGAASSDDGNGHGLVGMRERIAVHRGSVVAGPRVGGGFEVRAVIPRGQPEPAS